MWKVEIRIERHYSSVRDVQLWWMETYMIASRSRLLVIFLHSVTETEKCSRSVSPRFQNVQEPRLVDVQDSWEIQHGSEG